jgi:hypothetical protein
MPLGLYALSCKEIGMTYPIVTASDAKRFLSAKRGNPDVLQSLVVRSREQGEEVEWDDIVEELADILHKKKAGVSTVERGSGGGGRFEAEAARAVHQAMPRFHPALSDSEFWTWLAVAHFSDVVEWRYGSKKKPADLKNYGIGSSTENLLYRLWLRAELAYDSRASDPYHLVSYGDVDFWRSHLFRQGYATARQFARAFLKFQFSAGRGQPRLSIRQVRDLAKRLKRSRTNLLVEVMDEAQATRFIESEWAKLEGAGG